MLKGASAIGRKELALLGTCFGKFSGSGKFRLHITCLDYLAQVFTASLPSSAADYVFVLYNICIFEPPPRLVFLTPVKQYAKHKVWVKPAAEMSFLYGNHVLKAGVGRVTDGVQQHCGVVVVNMADVQLTTPLVATAVVFQIMLLQVPLGFGVMSKSGVEIRGFGPTDIVVLHQADIGEFLRDEDTGARFVVDLSPEALFLFLLGRFRNGREAFARPSNWRRWLRQ